MTSDLRWRIMTLQAALVFVFAFGAGFLFWASGYVQSTVHNQLAAQTITFPAANSPALKALPPADAAAMRVYAGELMITGAQAETYADHFIKIHLRDMGMTYSQVSAKLLADPNNASLQQLDNTIFKGTTLRGMLLNAYGWWTVGTYTSYAAIAVLLAAIAVFGAFLFELLIAVKRETLRPIRRTVRRGQPVPTV